MNIKKRKPINEYLLKNKNKKLERYLNSPKSKIPYWFCKDIINRINIESNKSYNVEDIFNPLYIKGLPLKAVFVYSKSSKEEKKSIWKFIDKVLSIICYLKENSKKTVKNMKQSYKLEIINKNEIISSYLLLLILVVKKFYWI